MLRMEVDKIRQSFEPNRRLSVQLSVHKEVSQNYLIVKYEVTLHYKMVF